MSSNRIRAALALCAGLCLGLAARAEANLLIDGSFERPGCSGNCIIPSGSLAIEGWTTLLSGVEYVDPRVFGSGAAPDGRMVVDLANYVFPQGGGIAQTFATVVGSRYLLSFWSGNAEFDGRIGSGTVHVQVAGVDRLIETPQAASRQGIWRQTEIGFQALSSRTELVFSNTQDPLQHYALIDDVAVTAVSEPGSRWLAMTGLLVLLVRRRLKNGA